MKIREHDTLLFIGDSITETGRDETGEPTPWNRNTGLGQGYVELFNAIFANEHPSCRIRVINRGIGGNTVRNLEDRWTQDVLNLKPQWLFVSIGINDVWRQFDSPMKTDEHIDASVFKSTYQRIIKKARETPELKGIYLLAPFLLEKDPTDPFLNRMNEYGRIVQDIAAENDARFIDCQAEMDKLMTYQHPCEIAWDRIHINATGHYALARSVMNALNL
ncbi:SGNH/GDSL hydrolase family protein [Puniceicoccaceae bacterium K14]|nr:SGNH/GDSL hydrolase family protein [Puniceicoccaceae bacterium K14]